VSGCSTALRMEGQLSSLCALALGGVLAVLGLCASERRRTYLVNQSRRNNLCQ